MAGLSEEGQHSAPKDTILRLCLQGFWLCCIINAWGVLGLIGTAVRLASCLICGGIGIALLAHSAPENRRAIVLLILPIAVFLIGVTYSLAPERGFVCCVSLFGATVFFLGLSHRWKQSYWKNTIASCLPIWAICITIAAAEFIRDKGWQYERYGSLLGGGNDAGALAGLLVWLSGFALIFERGARRVLLLYLLCASVLLAICGDNKTTNYAFVMMAVLLLCFKSLGRTGVLVGATMGLIIYVSASIIPGTNLPFSRLVSDLLTGSRETDRTLTGRGLLWRHGIMAVQEKPLFGFGTGSTGMALGLVATATERSHYLQGDVTGDVHSDYLRIAIDNGILGLVPFALLVGTVGWLVFRRNTTRGSWSEEDMQQFGIVGIGFVAALTSSNFFSAGLPYALLSWSAIVGALMRKDTATPRSGRVRRRLRKQPARRFISFPAIRPNALRPIVSSPATSVKEADV